ncbi:hypothetical protein Pla108_23590 [Botrimarina colliarenosi]|uniref:Uncharacterized protein n=1 Tax=Botrimarina colliarenosi TaxID=2528001 RepID=A0A5C6AGL0_9BACT|nr:hypothetical protein Pla108_23590 [Botrimarina colliarenosi]
MVGEVGDLRIGGSATLDPVEQLCDADLEPFGDLLDVSQSDVSLPPLDATLVGAIKPGMGGEALLGITGVGAELADPLPETLKDVGSFCHSH